MLDYYQMTLEEVIEDGAKTPKIVISAQPGLTDYACRLCGAYVGIYNHGVDHMDKGWIYRREVCKFGHEIDWEKIDEALQTR